MRVLVDTNILLDYYMEREPFLEDADKIFALCVNQIKGFVAVHSFSNFYYILHNLGKFSYSDCRNAVVDICSIFEVAGFQKQNIVDAAIDVSFSDFEDALQVECAKSCCADYIITRNVADYKSSAVPAILPSDFLELKI